MRTTYEKGEKREKKNEISIADRHLTHTHTLKREFRSYIHNVDNLSGLAGVRTYIFKRAAELQLGHYQFSASYS